MNVKNGRKTKIRQERQDGELNRFTRCVGDVTPSGSEPWANTLGVSGDDSYKSNTSIVNTGETIPGGIARQLIEEARKQLAYHKTQASQLEERIQELEQFTENLVEEPE